MNVDGVLAFSQLLGGVALDGDCREGGTFAFSAIRLKLAFSQISYCTFKTERDLKASHIMHHGV